MADALTALSNRLAQSARPTWHRRTMRTRRSSCTGQLALLGSFLLLSLGCGAPPEDRFDSDSSPLYSGPGPAQILVSTSPRVSERCPGELAATYCSATEVSAAADSCRRRLPPDVVAACPRTGCVQPYAAYRDRCVAGATYVPHPGNGQGRIAVSVVYLRHRALSQGDPHGNQPDRTLLWPGCAQGHRRCVRAAAGGRAQGAEAHAHLWHLHSGAARAVCVARRARCHARGDGEHRLLLDSGLCGTGERAVPDADRRQRTSHQERAGAKDRLQ